MLFNSYVFLFAFLPLALLGWWQLRDVRLRLVFITLMSYVFYCWWDWRFLPVMLASTLTDYVAGRKIATSARPGRRKAWLVASLTINLSMLAFFKYYDFAAGSLNHLARWLVHHDVLPLIAVSLPIGISFYTFNSMSYTIDVYRRATPQAPSPLHFSAFVALFPHLIAGPIVRYSDIQDQLRVLKPALSSEQAARGVFFLAMGMAKKVLIADRLAGFVDAFFATPGGHGLPAAWIGVLGYTLQIYFDFSGYSDMAVGLAHLLGFQFPQNFNSPYKATNIADFWRRWHMSLSFWLRDYLFIPLGGSRRGGLRTALNLTITMFLGGLWHGANWTFVVWGLYHGGLLAGHHVLRARGIVPRTIVAARTMTFASVSVGWIFFRCDTLPAAGVLLWSVVGGHGFGLSEIPVLFVAEVLIGLAIVFATPNTWEIRLAPRPAYAVALATMLFLSVLYLGQESPFLYFQF